MKDEDALASEQLAIKLGASVISDISPEEDADYPELVAQYLKSPAKAKGDHPLGFGMGELVGIATPYVYEASKIVVLFLMAQLTQSVREIASGAIETATAKIKSQIDGWIASIGSKQPTIRLSGEQKKQVDLAIRERLGKLKADKSTIDAIISSFHKVL